VRIEFRWGARGRERIQQNTAEMVALAPDVVVANSASIAGSMKEATRNIPIVFVQAVDPVGAGLVESLAHPGGNLTGFTQFEFGVAAIHSSCERERWPALCHERHRGCGSTSTSMRKTARSSLQARSRRHRVEAARLAVQFRPLAALDQDQETIWPLCSTGSAVACCRGMYRSPWRRRSASKATLEDALARHGKPFKPTRARSSLARPSPACSPPWHCGQHGR
jgi:hypothetical protein